MQWLYLQQSLCDHETSMETETRIMLQGGAMILRLILEGQIPWPNMVSGSGCVGQGVFSDGFWDKKIPLCCVLVSCPNISSVILIQGLQPESTPDLLGLAPESIRGSLHCLVINSPIMAEDYMYMVCPEGSQRCNMKNRDIYWRRYRTQEILYGGQWHLSPIQSGHLGTLHSSPNCHQLSHHIFLNLISGLKSLPFQRWF